MTRTPSRTPTITPTLAPGPDITFFGLASASGVPQTSSGTTGDGVPIFERITGSGFLFVIEARPGANGSTPGNRRQGIGPNDRGDIQMQVDRNLGNGSLAVCDTAGMDPNQPAGGVPAISPPSYDEGSQMITDALNDLGCRFDFNTTLSPCTVNERGFAFASPLSTVQFCSSAVVDFSWRFPEGDTLVTARWRDQAGTFSPLQRIVVRVSTP